MTEVTDHTQLAYEEELTFVYFCFYYLYFGRSSKKKKKMLRFMSKSILPKTPLEFYSILFSFRSLIHFEFIFVYGVTECSRFCHLQKHGTWRALG